MAQAGWREEIDHAQEVTDYDIGGRDYPRIRYGEEQRGGGSWHIRNDGSVQPCHDCSVQVGQFHVPGCDIEECPKCGGQSISCNCDNDEEEGA